jgi:hypothetical protein
MTTAAPVQSAATVILLRPGSDNGPEVLLNRRPAAMKFLGGFYVFPGGTVKKEDCSQEALSRPFHDRSATSIELNVDPGAFSRPLGCRD